MDRLAPFAKALYRDPGFFDSATCARIRRAMDTGQPEAADVLHDAVESRDDVRRASYIDVDAAVLTEVEACLDAQRDAIAAHFGLALTAREGAGFVRYPEGGFYMPHRDRADAPSWPGAARRRIAAVVFLNDDFDGGILRLLDAAIDLEERRHGVPVDIVPRQGMLVAFHADTLHEVTAVRGGPRDAIVDWFY